MAHRNLAAFARWFLSQPFGSLQPPDNAGYQFHTLGGVINSVVLCRDAPYQAELFTALGPGHFAPHSHPNVDAIEVLLGGDIQFVRGLSGERIQRQRVRVRAGEPHSAILGAAGACFLSLQKWRRGVQPTSVGLDWDGPPHLNYGSAR